MLERIWGTHTFQTTHYQIRSAKLNGLKREWKVALLSDLHNYKFGKDNETLLEAIKREQPDTILIAGDMLVGKVGESTDIAEQFVRRLPDICETYYANGNHEYRMKIYEEKYGDAYKKYYKTLTESGVRFLENEKVCMNWDGKEVEIYGLEIPAKSYQRLNKAVFTKTEMEACLGQADRDKYEVVIAHNPAFVPTYLEWGADLILSGHLHGGIIRIPGIGGVITPQFRLFPKYSGELTEEGEASVVVSRGLGTHTIPVRVMNQAEFIVLHIGGKEET